MFSELLLLPAYQKFYSATIECNCKSHPSQNHLGEPSRPTELLEISSYGFNFGVVSYLVIDNQNILSDLLLVFTSNFTSTIFFLLSTVTVV